MPETRVNSFMIPRKGIWMFSLFWTQDWVLKDQMYYSTTRSEKLLKLVMG